MTNSGLKKELRKKMLTRRDHEPSEERLNKSRSIHENLFAQEFYQKAKCVYCYVSFRSEVDTRELLPRILQDGKKLFVPRVDPAKDNSNKMQFYEITSLDDLTPGSFGIPEPNVAVCNPPEMHPSGLMLLPGAAFDRHGRRIGYGGGYYDRYLEAHPDFYKAALAFTYQICDGIQPDTTDIPVDVVITESYVWNCGKS